MTDPVLEAIQSIESAKDVLRQELGEAISRYYEKHAAGGKWHIVLDDGNVSDDAIGWCRGHMDGEREPGPHSPEEAEEYTIGAGLLQFTEREREQAYNHGWDFVRAHDCCWSRCDGSMCKP